MEIRQFIKCLNKEFFCGVPDSQLKPLCDFLFNEYGIDPKHHIIAANEGNCAALAAGYHLSTGEVPVVYMQNSGEGNIINPVASLLNDKVYAIPCIFIVGWRGEPGVHDEPQHIYQGEVTIKLLEDMDIATFVVDKSTREEEIEYKLNEWQKLLEKGKQVAFVVRKNAFENSPKVEYKNSHTVSREEAIKHIVAVTGDDPIISTTGKASRELFEIREGNGQGHGYDFLTVGSMGHSSSIALAIAIQKSDRKIWCIDGDGAVLMHMGSMALIGTNRPKNLVHIVINNGAHETVGGMPTVCEKINLTEIAKACGYEKTVKVNTLEGLDKALNGAKKDNKLTFIEVMCAIGSRADLGRPTTTPQQNKADFMKNLSAKNGH